MKISLIFTIKILNFIIYKTLKEIINNTIINAKSNKKRNKTLIQNKKGMIPKYPSVPGVCNIETDL